VRAGWARCVIAAAAAAICAVLAGVCAPIAAAAPGPADAPEWWFDSWNLASLQAAGVDGRHVTVAVVDTGVQASLAELAGKVLPGADYTGNGTDGRTDLDQQEFSHGTAMASIIAARPGAFGIAGVAPGVKILPIAVPLRGISERGSPDPQATTKAIYFAVDHGAKVINMSLGGPRYPGGDDEPCPTKLQAAIIFALAHGALVVAASGNSGQDGNPVEEPSVCLGVVSVGAVDRTLRVADFSSRHPYLTVTAPGVDIASLSRTVGNAFHGDGTSQSTALVSAALALIWSKYPHDTNRAVLTRLLRTAQDLGPPGHDSAYGYGVIAPAAAIAATAATSGPNPVFDNAQPLLDYAAARASAGGRIAPVQLPPGHADLGTFTVGRVPSTLTLPVMLRAGLAGALMIAALGSALFARWGRHARSATGSHRRAVAGA
jgi:subtilisin family serine protease